LILKPVAVAPVFARAAELCLPVIVLGEYGYGLQGAVDELCRDARILSVDSDTARVYAVVRSHQVKIVRLPPS